MLMIYFILVLMWKGLYNFHLTFRNLGGWEWRYRTRLKKWCCGPGPAFQAGNEHRVDCVFFCTCVCEAPRRKRCMGVPRWLVMLSRCFPLSMFILIQSCGQQRRNLFQYSALFSSTKQPIAPFSLPWQLSQLGGHSRAIAFSPYFPHILFLPYVPALHCSVFLNIILFQLLNSYWSLHSGKSLL